MAYEIFADAEVLQLGPDFDVDDLGVERSVTVSKSDVRCRVKLRNLLVQNI